MHIVQFGLKLKSQLYLFFMILSVLHVVLFQFESHGSLIGFLTLQFLTVFLERVLILLQYLLIVSLLLEFGLVILVEFV